VLRRPFVRPLGSDYWFSCVIVLAVFWGGLVRFLSWLLCFIVGSVVWVVC